mmetsp:Transcript_16724/g.45983  ORF Transcript_16724/g.45983 Transcript_16724/m.45983 type:complete len:111 (-) Transcript_16724:489-821(-)
MRWLPSDKNAMRTADGARAAIFSKVTACNLGAKLGVSRVEIKLTLVSPIARYAAEPATSTSKLAAAAAERATTLIALQEHDIHHAQRDRVLPPIRQMCPNSDRPLSLCFP